MLPIRLIETEREDFDGPVIELWREKDFIGFVFWDGEATILQVYPDGDGDVHDIDVRELQMLLDTAVRIVDPDAFNEEMDELRAVAGAAEAWGDEHPATVQLLADFDDRAVFRSDDGEGFFNRNTASQFISKCEDLDLAVVEMDGLTFDGDEVTSQEGLELEVPDQPMMTWSEFRAFANANAHSSLDSWPTDEDLVVAFVFRQPDGEDIVA